MGSDQDEMCTFTALIFILLNFSHVRTNEAEFMISMSNPCSVEGIGFDLKGLSRVACASVCMENSSCKGIRFNQSDGQCCECPSVGIPGQVHYSGPLLRKTKGRVCSEYLVESIPDSYLSASSIYDATHIPSRARLSTKTIHGILNGAWMADLFDTNKFIQAQFMSTKEIMRIVTKGKDGYEQYLTTYSVSYSVDCIIFAFVKDADEETKIFSGNNNAATSVIQDLPQSVLALCIRIHPITWEWYPSLRFDVIGCDWKHDPVIMEVNIQSAERPIELKVDYKHTEDYFQRYKYCKVEILTNKGVRDVVVGQDLNSLKCAKVLFSDNTDHTVKPVYNGHTYY